VNCDATLRKVPSVLRSCDGETKQGFTGKVPEKEIPVKSCGVEEKALRNEEKNSEPLAF